MMQDDIPVKPENPLAAMAAQDLEPQSVAELEQRIVKLKAEIERTERLIKAKKTVIGAAHGLFKS